jgi:hypothetical protein
MLAVYYGGLSEAKNSVLGSDRTVIHSTCPAPQVWVAWPADDHEDASFAYRNDQHGKLLRMASSCDRAGTVGFRWVMDAE